MGFIFYNRSPRYVNEESLAFLKTPRGSIKRVGVFVNEDLSNLNTLLAQYYFDCIQLHGTESPQYILSISNNDISIIKAFSIHDEFDWDSLIAYDGVVDYFLFDTATDSYGGSGKKFNWGVLKNYQLDKPFFLSGGISIEDANSLEELNMPLLQVVDINSCFEISPGLKDAQLVNRFLNKIRDEKLPS